MKDKYNNVRERETSTKMFHILIIIGRYRRKSPKRTVYLETLFPVRGITDHIRA